MFEAYKDYVNDNPQGYWFKRKLYGWGWTPVKWQGWLVTLGFVGVALIIAFATPQEVSTQEVLLRVMLPLALVTIIFISICYKKGEVPKWQWGIPDNTSPHDSSEK
jgi:hypothetical protein